MNVTGRQAEVHTGWESIPRQSEGCFVSLIGDLPTGAEQWWRRSINQQRPPLKHTSPVPQVWQLPPMRPSPGHRSRIQVAFLAQMHLSQIVTLDRIAVAYPEVTFAVVMLLTKP